MPLEILVFLITFFVIIFTISTFVLIKINKRNKNSIVLNIVPEAFEVNFIKAKQYSAFIRRTGFSLIGVAGALTGALPQLTMNIINKQTGEQIAYNPWQSAMTRRDAHGGALLTVGKFTITESGLYNIQIVATQNVMESDLLEIK